MGFGFNQVEEEFHDFRWRQLVSWSYRLLKPLLGEGAMHYKTSFPQHSILNTVNHCPHVSSRVSIDCVVWCGVLARMDQDV